MQRYIQSLSANAEFGFVLLAAFGYFTLVSVATVLFFKPGISVNNAGLGFLIVYEFVVLAGLWKFLSLRGWKLVQFGLIPTVRDTLIGAGLFVSCYAVYVASWIIVAHTSPELLKNSPHPAASHLNWVSVVAVSILNPVYEELFVCGYIITALKKTRSLSYAINVSVGVRLAYHLYQGATGVINIIPLGFIFAYWFAKKGRLWPLIIAHALFDFLGLLPFLLR